MKTTLSRAMRYISSHRQAASGAALALAVILIFTLVSSPAVVGVSASRRSLPVYSVERDGKYAALTFDAAWGNEDTEQLIDILTHYGVRATFFVVGSWVDKYPESVRDLADAGMEVMNHSNTHAHFASLSAAEVVEDVNACSDKVESVTGVRPTLFRCPYGEYDDEAIDAIRGMGVTPIQWDVDSLDWKGLDAAQIERRVVNGVTYNFDSTGAGTVAWPYKSPVVIPPEDQKSELQKALDAVCDGILAQITNSSMGERQKAEAIYRWVRGNLRYSGHSATRDWVTEAYQGFRRRHGDCYTYFSVSQALLTRAGLPSIEVIRNTDNDHYWNMTQVDGVWYHFDTTPRSWGGWFCLLTDAQMAAYSAAHRGCFSFTHRLYPPSP